MWKIYGDEVSVVACRTFKIVLALCSRFVGLTSVSCSRDVDEDDPVVCCSEVQEISSEDDDDPDDEDDGHTSNTETASSRDADSARSTPVPGATPTKRGRIEGMPKKRFQKAGLFSNTYKEEE